MGKMYLRRFRRETYKWSDRSAKRHKHDFSQKCVIHTFGVSETNHVGHSYYLAISCDKCNSFTIDRILNLHGVLFSQDDYNIVCTLNHKRFIKPHGGINFNDLVFVDNEKEIIIS